MGCPSTLSPLWMMLPFASSTAADLQRMFDTVTVFGGRMGFQLNVRQSGVVICGPLRRRQQIIEGSFVWRMAADTVPVVTSSKHLGVAGCARSATRSRDPGAGKRQVTASLCCCCQVGASGSVLAPPLLVVLPLAESLSQHKQRGSFCQLFES